MSRRHLGILGLAAVLCAGSAGAQLVTTELMLLCDVSNSIDDTEWALQRDGYVNAFNSAGIIDLIAQAPGGVATRISSTPATCAGITAMSSEEG